MFHVDRKPVFYHSKHAANFWLGTVPSRTNVRFGMTSPLLLLQVQLRARITLRHMFSHGANVGNDCADRAAALGAVGLVSNRHVSALGAIIHSRNNCCQRVQQT